MKSTTAGHADASRKLNVFDQQQQCTGCSLEGWAGLSDRNTLQQHTGGWGTGRQQSPVKMAATSSAVSPPAAPPKLVFMLVRCTTSADTAFAMLPLVLLTYMYTEPLLKPAQA